VEVEDAKEYVRFNSRVRMIPFYLLSRVGLTSGRATEKERHLTVSDGLLGKIVVDDKSVLSIVTEILPFQILALA